MQVEALLIDSIRMQNIVSDCGCMDVVFSLCFFSLSFSLFSYIYSCQGFFFSQCLNSSNLLIETWLQGKCGVRWRRRNGAGDRPYKNGWFCIVFCEKVLSCNYGTVVILFSIILGDLRLTVWLDAQSRIYCTVFHITYIYYIQRFFFIVESILITYQIKT